MRKLIVLAALVFLSLGGVASSSKADTLKIRADVWCPYNCDPKSADRGYMIEILDKYAAQNGHTIDYQTMPWARALAETRAGNIDGVVGLGPGDISGITVSQGIGKDVSCFFVKADNSWTYGGSADLDKLKMIGATQDYVYTDVFMDWIGKNKSKIDWVGGDTPLETNLKKLMAGRSDAILDNENVVGFIVKSTPAFTGVKKAGCLEGADVYVGLSPKNPKTADHIKGINKVIDEMRKNGELDKLSKKYGVAL